MATENPAENDPRAHAGRGGLRRSLRAVPSGGAVLGSLGSAAVAQVALVVTGVITARTLGPADRGYLALVILVPAVVHGLGTLGLPRAVTYFIASDPRQEAAVLSAIRTPVAVQAVALTALQASVLPLFLANEPGYVQWAGVAVLPLLAANLGDTYGMAILQGQRRYVAFNILRNAGLGFYLVGVLLVLASGHTTLVAFAVTYVVATALSAIVTVTTALARRAPLATEAVSRRDLLRFGLRGHLAWLSPIGTFRLDQLLIGVFLTPYALGLYVVGLAFTNVPTFIARSVGFIAFPQVARAKQRGQEMQRFFWFSTILSGSAALLLELGVGWLVPLFFGSQFDDAVTLARILLLGAFFESARHVLTSTSSGGGRPGVGSIAELSSWFIFVPAVALLMPRWGAEGVAGAVAIASATSFFALVVLLRVVKHEPEAVRAGTAERNVEPPTP